MKRALILIVLAMCLFCGQAAAKNLPAYGATRADILEKIGYDGSQIYHVGSTGEPVRFIQTALSETGYYDGEITGVYDEATEEAVGEILTDTGFHPERGQCDPLRMYRIVELYLDQYDDPAEHAEWNDILDALGKNGSYAFGKTVAKLENGKITVSGGTVLNVKMDGNLPAGTHTVVFEDTMFISDVEITAAAGETLNVFFDEDTAMRLENEKAPINNKIYAKALRGGTIEIVLEGSAYTLRGDAEEGGEVSLINRGVVYAIGSVDLRGRLSMVNEGDAYDLFADLVDKGTVEIKNRGNVSRGQIRVIAGDNSRAAVENNSVVRGVDFHIAGNASAELVNKNTIRTIAINAWGNSEVLLNNSGVIYNEGDVEDVGRNLERYRGAYGEEHLAMHVHDNAKVEYSGNGIVKPGYTWDGLLFEYLDERTPTVTACVYMHLSEPCSTMKEARIAAIEAFRSRIKLPLDGLQSHSGMDQVALSVSYQEQPGEDEESIRFLVRQEELYELETGDAVEGEDAFEELPPVDVPTLVFPDGEIMDAEAILKYTPPKANGENAVVYNVHLINRNGEEIELPGECILCFPYPEGLDENSGNKYRIIIHHQINDKETEVFKSEDGEIEFKKQGLCIRVNSLSPFEITWEEHSAANLPRTGDDSLPMSFLLLAMTVSLCGFCLTAKKRYN